MNFKNLVNTITSTNLEFKTGAAHSLNKAMTLRNWLLGYYMVQYDQNGSDRAKYGKKYFISLSRELKKQNLRGMSVTNLKLFRLFYREYPTIEALIPDNYNNIKQIQIRQSVTDELQHDKPHTIKLPQETDIELFLENAIQKFNNQSWI